MTTHFPFDLKDFCLVYKRTILFDSSRNNVQGGLVCGPYPAAEHGIEHSHQRHAEAPRQEDCAGPRGGGGVVQEGEEGGGHHGHHRLHHPEGRVEAAQGRGGHLRGGSFYLKR